MFYTPNFCCECGDKIERDNWTFRTSRRFCESCENDFQWQKWLPLGWIAVGLVGIIYGFGSYLKEPGKPVNLITTSTALTAANRSRNLPNQSNLQVSANNSVQSQTQSNNINGMTGQTNSPSANLLSEQRADLPKQNQIKDAQNDTSEPVYMCGAKTKKGAPCTRRVKGGGRCWQHTGQPAMLPAEKLIISR